MKGTFFNKPLEWSIETSAESWQQGEVVSGTLKVKNHAQEEVKWNKAGVALAYAEVKKVHARTQGALKPEIEKTYTETSLGPGETLDLSFSLHLPENCSITDKKASYFLTYGRELTEGHLMLKIEPRLLFTKVTGLLDTFHRFKIKDIKGSKKGVEYKLLPPTSREMASLETLVLSMQMKGKQLEMNFDFKVKKLDTSSVSNKMNKESVKIKRELSPKEYSLGQDMINQDQLLKVLESVLDEVKLNNIF